MIGGDDDTVAGARSTLSGAGTPPDRIPELVANRYQIVRWLGSGGMGRVYEALDTELGEKVALKVLRAELTDEALQRFRREVKLTRRIQHRNVARMFDIGDHEGDKFLTMELVDGVPLTREIQGPLAWPRLQHLAVQICDGLAAAHAAGVIHRDLKPDNVLIERGTDRAVITDFGIARSGDDANVTQVGAVIGTPRYMAPEQLAGQDIDERADLFSLGVMLFELATGTLPWSGDNAVSIAVSQVTQPARSMGPVKMPRDFIALVERCVTLDRELRPASARAIGQTIAACAIDVDDTHRVPKLPDAPEVRGAHDRRDAFTPPPDGPHSGALTTIAVLPFTCATADEYLADGLLDDLIDTLSSTATLRVRPAGVVRSQTAIDPRDVGRRLEVDHVVIGSVRRTPSGLRVSARLVGIADGFQIWAQRVDCTEAELLSVSERLSSAVATALSTRAAAQTKPMDQRAVDYFLRARAELRRFWGEHTEKAAELLEQAASFAPTSGAVLGALAFARVQTWIRRGVPELLPLAARAVERSLLTGHGDAYLASALLKLNLGDLDGGAHDLGIALVRAPMSSQAHEVAGRILIEVGAEVDGRHHFEIALGLDPGRAPIIAGDLARLDALQGDPASAMERLRAVVADPDPSLAQLGSLYEARIAGWYGDGARLESAARRLSPRLSSPVSGDGASRSGAGLLVIYQRWLADRTFDLTSWHALLTSYPGAHQAHRVTLVSLQRMAEVAMLMQQHHAALLALEAADAAGLIDQVWIERCPLFAPVIDDPAFQALRGSVAQRAARVQAAFRAASG